MEHVALHPQFGSSAAHPCRISLYAGRLAAAACLFAGVLAPLTGRNLARAQEDAARLAKPVDVTLKTKDGIDLAATYYRSAAGANAPVVILLHMHGGDRRDWSSFAEVLQKADFAVLNLDLRGHGDSKLIRGKSNKPIVPDQLDKTDYLNMVTYDLEAAKGFLVEKNNARELNIEKLGVVGAEMSAGVAVLWANSDWSWEALPGIGKQGKDVKALVLISPQWNYQGLDIRDALPALRDREQIAMLFIAGQKDRQSMRDAMRMFRLVNSINKENTLGHGYDTSLEGTMMLGKDLPIEEDILKFLSEHLKNVQAPWAERTRALGAKR